MAATTRPPSRDGGAAVGTKTFDGVERAVHWVNAALFLTLVVTGAALYLQPLGELIGRRALVQDIHVYCGVALPVPLIVGVSGPWGRRLRADLGRFNRWTAADRRWLRVALAERSRRRADRAVAGDTPDGDAPDGGAHRALRFNAGQKLNAAWTAGAGMVMLGTGAIMRWYHPWPLSWRTGATFVHDWVALAVGLVILGHVLISLSEPESMRAMTGLGRNRRGSAGRGPGTP